MGCDIHAFAEVRRDGRWEQVVDVFPLDDWEREYYKRERGDEFFMVRSYGVFGFLAGVRNYSEVTPLSPPKGLPDDLSPEVQAKARDWEGEGHSYSWLTLRELLAADYDGVVWDRRYTRQEGPDFFNGAATALETETHLGTREPLREFLGAHFMKHLDVLKTLGDPEHVRIVFWFDN